jgi:energy-coupling factor transporter ATP-binding protein EcfA2
MLGEEELETGMLFWTMEEGGYLIPAEYRFHVYGTKQAPTIDRVATYTRSVNLDEVRKVLGHGLSNQFDEITADQFARLIALMQDPVMSEGELLTHLRDYINARGYYFDDETVANYHVCLKTRPFVILAGLSGTGKSKLSQLYAEALGHPTRDGRYLRVAVRPSWNDDRYLLGYLNSLTGDYAAEPALDFIIRAEEDRDNLYFFCLDEMNLAHVEHYFSQFLSALEEEETADRKIPLYSHSRLRGQDAPAYKDTVLLPPNLLFTGTVNVDETTQPISDKVIDRANTLEFFDVALDKVPARRPTPEVTPISARVWAGYRAAAPDDRFRPQVVAIGRILNKAGMGLGYRVLREIELYVANSAGLLAPEVAFDLQVKQRVLPRLRGTLTLRETLNDLIAFAKENSLPRSAARLEEMQTRLNRDGYTSFWR